MIVHLATEPAAEPVTLAEAKAHLRLEGALDDLYVSALISTARRYVEQVCWRGIVTQSYEVVAPSFFGQEREMTDGHHHRHLLGGFTGPFAYPLHRQEQHVRLPRGQLAPLADLLAITPALNPEPDSPVISVKYIDPNGDEQTLDPDQYSVDAASVPGRLRLAHNCSWPSTREQWDAVKVVYWVGWAAARVPEPIKQAILLLVSQLYEHRTPEVIARAIVQIQFTFDALLAPYSLAEIG